SLRRFITLISASAVASALPVFDNQAAPYTITSKTRCKAALQHEVCHSKYLPAQAVAAIGHIQPACVALALTISRNAGLPPPDPGCCLPAGCTQNQAARVYAEQTINYRHASQDDTKRYPAAAAANT